MKTIFCALILPVVLFNITTVSQAVPAWSDTCFAAITPASHTAAPRAWSVALINPVQVYNAATGQRTTQKFVANVTAVVGTSDYRLISGQCDFAVAADRVGAFTASSYLVSKPVASPWISTKAQGVVSINQAVADRFNALLSDTINEGDQTARVATYGDADLPDVDCSPRISRESGMLKFYCTARIKVELRLDGEDEPSSSELRSCRLQYRVVATGESTQLAGNEALEQDCLSSLSDGLN